MKNVVPIIFIIAAIWLFFGYIKPLYTEVSAKRVTITEKQSVLDQAHQLNTLKNNLLAIYKGYSQDDLDRIHKALPENVKPAHFMVSIAKLAENRGVIVKSVNFGSGFSGSNQTPGSNVSTSAAAPSTGQAFIPADALPGAGGTSEGVQTGMNVSPLALDITVAAAYPAFVIFLKDLEANLEIIDVTALSITGGKDQNDYKLTLNTYKLNALSASGASI